MKYLATLFCLAGLPVMAESPTAPDAQGTELNKVTYTCEGGWELQVIYVNGADDQNFAIVGWVSGMATLQQAVSGSGFRYVTTSENGELELSGKGNEVMLELDDAVVLRNCGR